MKISRSTWVLLVIAAATLLADQSSKYVVMTRMAPESMWAPVPAFASFFTVTYTTNTGVAFGLFKAWGTAFIGVAVVVIAAIVVYQSQVPADAWLVRAALGLQLGGAAGNLIDRLRLGHVTDFIHFHFWPVFNLADSAIVVGVVLLAFTMLREGQRESSRHVSSPGSGGSHPPA